jgi:DNA-binding NtrC family response regulator
MKPESVKVLLVEDNPGDMRLLKEYLNEASTLSLSKTVFEFASTDRLAQAKKWMESNRADVVLLDLSLPDSHGLDTFDRFHASAPQMPIIVLSGLDDGTVAIEAVRKGAQDYLVKGDVSASLLVRSIQYAIERKRSEENAKQAGQTLPKAQGSGEGIPPVLAEKMRSSLEAIGQDVSRCMDGGQGSLNEAQCGLLQHAMGQIDALTRMLSETIPAR